MDPMDLGTMGWGMLGTTAWEPAPATGVRLDTIKEGHMNILDFSHAQGTGGLLPVSTDCYQTSYL